MALTPDQEAQVEMQVAVENARHANILELEAKRARLEAIRLAKETLLENARNKPVGESDVSAADITVFADELVVYVNA